MADSVGWNADTGIGAPGNTDYPTYRNKSEFSGLPGGYLYYDGICNYIGYYGGWWSSSQYNTSSVFRHTDGKGDGFSVRCLRD